VDYKTGTHEGADLEAFLDRERERYRPQLERYAQLMRGLDARPIRLGLYFPLLGGWREWEFSAADGRPSLIPSPSPQGEGEARASPLRSGEGRG
jgi:hypothetical protein